MISKLKWRFVLINMSFVTIILLIVFTVVCTTAYHKACADTVATLHRMQDQISRPEPPDAMKAEIPQPRGGMRRRPDIPPIEPQQRTPAFVVIIGNDGKPTLDRNENITVDDELLSSATEYVQTTDRDEGVIRDLNLRYLRQFTQRGELIVFADRTNETQTLKNVLITSIGGGACGFMAFFAASIFLSGIALKPVKTAWETQRRFVADASHELKTPLTVILANMNILKANSAETVFSQMKWIENTGEEATRMKTLVDDMLFLAKGDVQKNNSQKLPLSLSELVMGTVLQFESIAFEKGIVIEDNIVPDMTIIGNEAQLKQLFGVLLDNACKYADENSKVTISAERENTVAVIRVNNKGAIISEEDIAHIFERFYRAEKSRVRKAGGYGLGLSIAESIVHSHGGKISVKSDSRYGTTFAVRLPLSK